MKTKAHLLIILSFALAINLNSQNYQVKMATNYQFDATALLKSYTSPLAEIDYSQYKVKELPTTTVVKNIESEIRVTGYYEDGVGTSLKWLTISLKLTVTTDTYGKDEITVKAYKNSNSNYWTDVNFSTVSKTNGNMAKEFTYQVYVASKTVYFSI